MISLLLVIKAVAPLLVAGLFGSAALGALGMMSNRSAQSEANRTSRINTRRTNENTLKIAREQNEFNLESMREQMKYLSPAEQRAMFEAAGYSPYAYLSQGGTSAPGMASSSGIPSLYNPSQITEDAIGQGLSSMSSGLSSSISSLAEADLKTQQAISQKLENSVFSERTKLTFEAMGLQNAYQRILNKYADQKEEVTVDLIKQQKELSAKQTDQVVLNNEIQSYYKDKIQPRELVELNKRIDFLLEQQRTQISLREYYQAMGHSALVQAEAQRSIAAINAFLSKYVAMEKAANALDAREHAALNKAVATGQIQENVLRTMFGIRLTRAQLNLLSSSKGLNEATIDKVYKESEDLQKTISWHDFNNVIKTLKDLGITPDKIFSFLPGF